MGPHDLELAAPASRQQYEQVDPIAEQLGVANRYHGRRERGGAVVISSTAASIAFSSVGLSEAASADPRPVPRRTYAAAGRAVVRRARPRVTTIEERAKLRHVSPPLRKCRATGHPV